MYMHMCIIYIYIYMYIYIYIHTHIARTQTTQTQQTKRTVRFTRCLKAGPRTTTQTISKWKELLFQWLVFLVELHIGWVRVIMLSLPCFQTSASWF